MPLAYTGWKTNYGQVPFHDDWIRFPRWGSQENARRAWRSVHDQRDLVSAMNNTKWRKLRMAMLALGRYSPSFRIMDAEYGQPSEWDGDWFHHFYLPNYAFIEWLELKAETPGPRCVLHEALRRLHLPGEETSGGFRIFGYQRGGKPLDYIR